MLPAEFPQLAGGVQGAAARPERVILLKKSRKNAENSVVPEDGSGYIFRKNRMLFSADTEEKSGSGDNGKEEKDEQLSASPVQTSRMAFSQRKVELLHGSGGKRKSARTGGVERF